MRGFIFRCNDKTREEVHRRRLFGEERAYLPLVKEIAPSDFLFLYNTSTFEFSGVFLPDSQGGEYIVPEAWQSKFPAQIKFKDSEHLCTLPFNKIEHIIKRFRNDIYPYMDPSEEQANAILNIINNTNGEV